MRSSFEQYVVARAPGLVRLAYVLCGDHHLAQDLVQEALAKVYRRWQRIESEDPDPYVRRAIVRSHLSWRRRRSSSETVTDLPPEQGEGNDFSTSFATRASCGRCWRRCPNCSAQC